MPPSASSSSAAGNDEMEVSGGDRPTNFAVQCDDDAVMLEESAIDIPDISKEKDDIVHEGMRNEKERNETVDQFGRGNMTTSLTTMVSPSIQAIQNQYAASHYSATNANHAISPFMAAMASACMSNRVLSSPLNSPSPFNMFQNATAAAIAMGSTPPPRPGFYSPFAGNAVNGSQFMPHMYPEFAQWPMYPGRSPSSPFPGFATPPFSMFPTSRPYDVSQNRIIQDAASAAVAAAGASHFPQIPLNMMMQQRNASNDSKDSINSNEMHLHPAFAHQSRQMLHPGGAPNQNSAASNRKKEKEQHIKKPLNAFMLFMKEMRPQVQAECTLKESAQINQILGKRWHELAKTEQDKYYNMAKAEREKHQQMFPGWSARDNYAIQGKKRKKKKDKNDEPKKCRAIFGIDNMNKWCKPCRRKKKCIRYMQQLQNQQQQQQSNNNRQCSHDSQHTLPSSSFDTRDLQCSSDVNDAMRSSASSASSSSDASVTSPSGPAVGGASAQLRTVASASNDVFPSAFTRFQHNPPTNSTAIHSKMLAESFNNANRGTGGAPKQNSGATSSSHFISALLNDQRVVENNPAVVSSSNVGTQAVASSGGSSKFVAHDVSLAGHMAPGEANVFEACRGTRKDSSMESEERELLLSSPSSSASVGGDSDNNAHSVPSAESSASSGCSSSSVCLAANSFYKTDHAGNKILSQSGAGGQASSSVRSGNQNNNGDTLSGYAAAVAAAAASSASSAFHASPKFGPVVV